MRPALSMSLFVALLALVTGESCATARRPAAPVVTPEGVRFVLMQPEAREVALAGSFNGWSTSSHPLTGERSSGLWTIVVALPPGEHLFMFIVDGAQWVSPPLAEDYVDDGFGSRNGVVVVRSQE